jgi:hypothetical protein
MPPSAGKKLWADYLLYLKIVGFHLGEIFAVGLGMTQRGTTFRKALPFPDPAHKDNDKKLKFVRSRNICMGPYSITY